MGFTIPTNDPNGAQQSTPPNVIRATTMDSFIQQDRFTLATSRRLVASIGRTLVTTASPQLRYRGQFNTSEYQGTRSFWFVASGEDAYVYITLNGVLTTLTLSASGFSVDANLTFCATSANGYYDFTVETAYISSSSGLLNGLYIVEERLALLP